MPNIVVFSKPQNLDTHKLAEVTQQTLVLLKPWAILKPDQCKGNLDSQLVDQVAKYIEAIKLTVSAAESGHTVTNEVLDLAKALEAGGKKIDIDDYVSGLLKIATLSREDATTAQDAFREIRREIMKLQESMSSQVKEIDPTLNQFIDHITAFIDWWDWVTIQTSYATSDEQPLEFDLDILRDQATVQQWNVLRESFVRYTEMIRKIEDSDPDFFRRPKQREEPRTYFASLFEMLKHAGFKLIQTLGVGLTDRRGN